MKDRQTYRHKKEETMRNKDRQTYIQTVEQRENERQDEWNERCSPVDQRKKTRAKLTRTY